MRGGSECGSGGRCQDARWSSIVPTCTLAHAMILLDKVVIIALHVQCA